MTVPLKGTINPPDRSKWYRANVSSQQPVLNVPGMWMYLVESGVLDALQPYDDSSSALTFILIAMSENDWVHSQIKVTAGFLAMETVRKCYCLEL